MTQVSDEIQGLIRLGRNEILLLLLCLCCLKVNSQYTGRYAHRIGPRFSLVGPCRPFLINLQFAAVMPDFKRYCDSLLHESSHFFPPPLTLEAPNPTVSQDIEFNFPLNRWSPAPTDTEQRYTAFLAQLLWLTFSAEFFGPAWRPAPKSY